jgi:hypothetical protein
MLADQFNPASSQNS